MTGTNMGRWLVMALLLPLGAPFAAAAQAPKQSWGRSGVSFEQYRRDAVECGRQGYYLDISKTADAKAFVRGSRELDDATQSASSPSPGADPAEAAVTRANQYE